MAVIRRGTRSGFPTPRSEAGATAVEYALLIALVAAAIAGASVTLGAETSGFLGQVSDGFGPTSTPGAEADCPLPDPANQRARERACSEG